MATDTRAGALQAELAAVTEEITSLHARLSGNGPASGDETIGRANGRLRVELADAFLRHRRLTADLEALVRPRLLPGRTSVAVAEGAGR